MKELSNAAYQTATVISLAVCLTVGWCAYTAHLTSVDGNKRDAEIQAIRVKNQHEMEMTKQKSIELDKSRKRKIWERAMPENNTEDSSYRGH